ncbi:hypothetical protein IFO70_27705 [Phormidium tenue FACHB-886]|nr:hypothetical protein [Phormidium tenue FACHB-886]
MSDLPELAIAPTSPDMDQHLPPHHPMSFQLRTMVFQALLPTSTIVNIPKIIQ